MWPRSAGDQRYRRHRDAIVDDRKPEFLGDLGTDMTQVTGDPLHLVIDVTAQAFATVAYAIQLADAGCYGADIELLGSHHVDGFGYLLTGKIEVSHLFYHPI